MHKFIFILASTSLLSACINSEYNNQEEELYQRHIENREIMMLKEENQLLRDEAEHNHELYEEEARAVESREIVY